jgi:hypothetical protein
MKDEIKFSAFPATSSFRLYPSSFTPRYGGFAARADNLLHGDVQ